MLSTHCTLPPWQPSTVTLFSTFLLLAGCIEGSAWPSRGGSPLPTTFGDTGTPPVVTTPDIPCNGPDQGTTAQLTIQNPNPETYRIHVMDAACEEQFFADVAGNDAWQGTVGNHLFFVVRESDGTYVRYFGIPSGTQVSWVESLP